MKKSAIINFNKNNILIFLRENKIFIMLTAAFIIGLAMGCVSFSKNTVASEFAKKLFDSFLTNRQGSNFLKIFSHSLSVRFTILLFYFLCGASLMGVVFIPLSTVFLGFIYGLLSAYTCNTYLLKGIAFNALVLIPGAIVFFIALTVASCKSIFFSFEFAKLTFPNSRPLNLFMLFKEYCGYYLIYLSVIIASSIIDALLSKSLITYFEFL